MGVAVVTGAARGQGQAHAIRLAADGHDVIALDVSAADDTVQLVQGHGRRAIGAECDVADLAAVTEAVDAGFATLGPPTVVVANAGIANAAPIEAMTAAMWQSVIDVNLTGAWNTVKACVPHMANGGAIVFVNSSMGGLKAPPGMAPYAASKHGMTGLMRSLAGELGPRGIRVNCVHPTAVDTPMIQNEQVWKQFRPDLEHPTKDDVVEIYRSMHTLPVPWIEPDDVAAAVSWLASDAARFITGISLPIDAGLSAR